MKRSLRRLHSVNHKLHSDKTAEILQPFDPSNSVFIGVKCRSLFISDFNFIFYSRLYNWTSLSGCRHNLQDLECWSLVCSCRHYGSTQFWCSCKRSLVGRDWLSHEIVAKPSISDEKDEKNVCCHD